MTYGLLADITVVAHLSFVLFVILGGLAVLRWQRLAWVHIPVFLYGAAIEFGGWICPLTHWENDLRRLGAEAGYHGSFVEHYILPLIYPDLLFSGGFPAWGFTAIGVLVLAVNGVVYWRLWCQR
jgi:hypothetical protein